MSFALRAVKAEDIRAFAARHGTTYVSNNAGEVWAAFLAQNGATGLNLPELESTWLSGAGAVGNNLVDLWGSYLNQLGYTGNFSDQIRTFFSSGEVETIPIASSFDNLILQNGFELLLESETTDGLVLQIVADSGLLQEDDSSFIVFENSLANILLVE